MSAAKKIISFDLDESFDLAKGGKLSPNAIDFEQKVLSAIIIDNESITETMDILKADMFYRPSHRLLYSEMLDMYQTGIPIDPLTLKTRLTNSNKLHKAGGLEYVLEINMHTSTSANIAYYSTVIFQQYLRRKSLVIANYVSQQARKDDENVYTVLEEAVRELLSVSESGNRSRIICVGEEIDRYIEEIHERRINPQVTEFIKTMITPLDNIIDGIFKSCLHIIAARPNEGKSALLMQILLNISMVHKKPTGLFSLEMTNKSNLNRLISQVANVDGRDIKTGELDEYSFQQIKHSAADLKIPMYIDDSSELNILQLRSRARKMKMDHNIEAVGADYLQLIHPGKKNERRDIDVGEVSRGLKSLAKELDVPVVAACQLNRAVTQSGKPRRPNLSDLRESGAIEQDADTVIFIHRPNPDDAHLYELILGKQRDGKKDIIEVRFTPEFTKFDAYNPQYHTSAVTGSNDDPF